MSSRPRSRAATIAPSYMVIGASSGPRSPNISLRRPAIMKDARSARTFSTACSRSCMASVAASWRDFITRSSSAFSSAASFAVGGGATRSFASRHILYSADTLAPRLTLYASCAESYSSTYPIVSLPSLRVTSTREPMGKPLAGGASQRCTALAKLSFGMGILAMGDTGDGPYTGGLETGGGLETAV